MRSAGRAVVLAVVLALTAGGASALAQPVDPSDEDLQRSRDAVSARAAEVGELTARLADLDARADELYVVLAAQREVAEAARYDLGIARDAAAAAAQRAERARVETDAATAAIDAARLRLDEFVAATYADGLDLGPLGLLTEATSPEDLVNRAEFTAALARSLQQAQDGLERARVDKANADSTARAALDEARAAEQAAAEAKVAADLAFAAADDAARQNAAALAAVDAERAAVQARLDAAEATDADLRAQRDRYRAWQRQQAEEQAARERAARDAAQARLGPAPDAPAAAGRGSVQQVIDRALSQLGVQYVWGGGNGRGPSTGIPDAFGSPLDRIGFDCSGLMLYAFNGVGVGLPRVSRNQFNAGRKVPISDLRPGDMVFYRRGSAPIHHVALYIGDNRMVEAPYTGANVRIAPLRRDNLVPQAVRVL